MHLETFSMEGNGMNISSGDQTQDDIAKRKRFNGELLKLVDLYVMDTLVSHIPVNHLRHYSEMFVETTKRSSNSRRDSK